MTKNTADSLRSRLKQYRQDMSASQRNRGSLLIRARLYSWLATTHSQARSDGTVVANVVAGFWPLPDEPNLIELYRQWHELGIIVVLPAMQADQSLHFYPWHPTMQMNTCRFGVMEPAFGQNTNPDIMLVPTLGFLPSGERLGYGKGYYDRTLQRLRMQGANPLTIGVAWDEANIMTLDPQYAASAHDQTLDAIITPGDWFAEAPKFRGADYSA
jgi:5-formyltetrahydrofolate cyclo-ligase